MDIRHEFDVSAHPGGFLFECADGCGRRLVIDRSSKAFTVIDKGDQFALHSGSLGGVGLLSAEVQPG
jgi:hypothetical protein